MKEIAVQFGKFKSLIGVLTEPDIPTTNDQPAVLLLNVGLIHRIGPNRIYVKLARRLASLGFRTLRFDLSGIGDSLPRPDHLPVEQFTIDDIIQAMDYLTATCNSQQFILMGHCSGAYHSFRTAVQDPRVVRVVMMNPDGGESEWIEYDRKRKMARYYLNYYGKKTLRDPQRWKRFFTGQVSYRDVLNNIFQNVIWGRISGLIIRIKQRFGKRQPTKADEKLFTMEGILRKLFELDTRMLLIYSEGATSLERAQTGMGRAIKQLSLQGKLQLSIIQGADHIFSPLASQADLFQVIEQWLAKRPDSEIARQ
jgi:pimeloyl-ACP methyl ester carboxylesterase